jgi:aromatic-L-amino-acid decarboxylase
MSIKAIKERRMEKVGDMDPEEFREVGHQMIDWIADFILKDPDSLPVSVPLKPGDIKERFPKAPPKTRGSMQNIWDTLREVIIPGVVNWNHPCFFGPLALPPLALPFWEVSLAVP